MDSQMMLIWMTMVCLVNCMVMNDELERRRVRMRGKGEKRETS